MKIAVIGGGASGIVSAIYAKRINGNNSVTVFERSDRILKKLLATGNGRCNLSNATISADNYASSHINLVKEILSSFSKDEEEKFFNSIGIILANEDGRIYPYSRRASSVLDALRFECDRLEVEIRTNSFINKIEKKGSSFIINGENFDRVILSVGSNAAPSFGTDGNGVNLLASLGHKTEKFHYALSPVKVKENTKSLKGIRAKGSVSLISKGNLIRTEIGEIQFADYGLSGIAVMQLSRLCREGNVLSLDLFPEMAESELFTMLIDRKDTLAHFKAEDFMTGFLHKELARYILASAGIKGSLPVSALSKKDISCLASLIKNLPFTVLSVIGKEQSQASSGGAYLSDFNPETLESLKCPGLFCTGELLDVVGDCGGYNLHWAWATGYVVGTSQID